MNVRWLVIVILLLLIPVAAGLYSNLHREECLKTYQEIVTDTDAYEWELQCPEIPDEVKI